MKPVTVKTITVDPMDTIEQVLDESTTHMHPSRIRNSTRLPIEEEEKQAGNPTYNDRNSEYEDDFEPVHKSGKTTSEDKAKAVKVTKSAYGTSNVSKYTSSEVEEPTPVKSKPQQIDPKLWSEARVELAELLSQFGQNKY